ncbi:MAG: hydroxyacid dehydrogenase [Planctomycetota bacterium]
MTQPHAVLLTDPLRDEVQEHMRAAGLRLMFPDDAPAVKAVCSGLLVRTSTRVDAALLDTLPALVAVATASVGYDHLDLDALRARGIATFCTPGANRDAAADHTLGMLLAVARHTALADRTLHAPPIGPGGWHRDTFTGIELAGKTLGIIGIGRVGSGVAHRALAFGMNVIAHDPYVSADTLHADVRGRVSLVPLDELLATSHVVTIHTPLNDETRNYLSAARLAALRPGTIVLNIARGGLLDEAALVDAIRSRHLSGAGLDVFATEPLPADSPLRTLDRVVLTPHIGGATVASQRRMQTAAADALVAVLQHGRRDCSLT